MPSSTSPIRLLHDLPRVTVRHRSVSEMANNVYVLTSKTSGTQVLIDAADDAEAVRELLRSAREDTPCELKLAVIITTHQHWDHVRALAEVAEATGVPTAAGTADAGAIEEATGVAAQVLLNHGDTAAFDGISLAVVGLRGHTPARWPWSTSPRTVRRCASAATRCSPAAWATRSRTLRGSSPCSTTSSGACSTSTRMT